MNQIKGTEADAVAGSITDEELAIHLANCLCFSDPALLAGTLSHIANFKSFTQLSRATRIRQASLFRMFSINTGPDFSDVLKVTCALGFRMHFEAISMLRDRASDHR